MPRLHTTFAVLVCLTVLVVSADNSKPVVLLKANGGTTFTLIPKQTDPLILDHQVDGVAQVESYGNCVVHFDIEVRPSTRVGQPHALTGTFSFVAADGSATLTGTAEGSAEADAVNPAFLNFSYQLTITGGTGNLPKARGAGEITGVAMLTSDSTGTATWTMKGAVVILEKGRRH